jgi:alkaline phosphatase D
MPDRRVVVRWEIGEDERLSKTVTRGVVLTDSDSAHSVHVEVEGLEPDRWYWYRFRVGNDLSPIGRTRTLPAPSAMPSRLRLASTSCQNYTSGYYAAWEHLAAQDVDLVVFLGDYIYEGGRQGPIRSHVPDVLIESLDDYRIRYAQYKTDPQLQLAHATVPFWVAFDDHEVINNWAGGEDNSKAFLARQAAAFQAWYEHQPLRRRSQPIGPDLLAYRRFDFGRLAQFSVLDTRQYRSDQPCGGGITPRCDEALSPGQTMTGAKQEEWLFNGLTTSRAPWNVIAQQTVMAGFDFDDSDEQQFNMDNWDGYVAARQRLLGVVRDHHVPGAVVLTGDIHAHFANELKFKPHDPDASAVGSEFVCSSMTTGKGNNDPIEAAIAAGDNPQVHYYNGRHRGYVRCDITPSQWRTDFFEVANEDLVTSPDAPLRLDASFVVTPSDPVPRQL